MRFSHNVLTVATLGLAVGDFAAAQTRVSVSDAPSCGSCRIVASRILSLGRAGDAELLADYPSVVHDSRGRYLVAGSVPRTRILVYDSSGAFRESWGRQGSGPGEYQAIVRLVRFANDSLAVIDAGTRRVSILTSSGRFARSYTSVLPLTDLVPLGSDSWAAAGIAFDSRAAQPLHVVATDGSIVRSFGGPITPQPGRLAAATRVIARDAGGRGIWSASPVRYEIERWTESGERTHVLDRDARWFPRVDVTSRNAWSSPIFPRLRALHAGSLGLLWTLSVVPKDGWTPSIQNYGGIESDHLNYDTVIEVIDPAAGRLVASQRFPWVGWGIADGGSVVGYRHTVDGILVVEIWKMDLVGFARR